MKARICILVMMITIPVHGFFCDMCENFFAQRWAVPTVACMVGVYAGIWLAGGYNNYKNREMVQENKKFTQFRSLMSTNEQLSAKCADFEHTQLDYDRLKLINKKLVEKNAAFEVIRHNYDIVLPIPKEKEELNLPTKEHVQHFKLLGFTHSILTREHERYIRLYKVPQE